ncbi:alpha/beta fold hydrolase [Microbulbifer taiwanensis]|uniref:Alpha/beta fold hydrolase n=1 Tax=Microbulbifer taiwanensis TaxID=986746 RepID=A0ABW1YLU3_9GAMM|nr:alpha/beta fold hydrolase [Microbulbifer taiwanensis]
MPYFSHRGRRLHFTDDSEGRGEPLLLLHGLGSRGSDWRPQIDGLAGEFRVLTLDFPGHGDSDPIDGPVTIADLARDVRALLDHLQMVRAHVVGLSLGGMVLFQLLADSPERLNSITVINSGPGLVSGQWRMKLLVAFRTLLIHSFGLPALAKKIAPKLFPRTEQQPLRDEFLRSIAAADKKSYLRVLRAIGAFNVCEKVAGSRIPALILSADNDYTPVSYKAGYTAQLGNARLSVIENSGHASPMDQPQACNQLIREFLREISEKEEKPLGKITAN